MRFLIVCRPLAMFGRRMCRKLALVWVRTYDGYVSEMTLRTQLTGSKDLYENFGVSLCRRPLLLFVNNAAGLMRRLGMRDSLSLGTSLAALRWDEML